MRENFSLINMLRKSNSRNNTHAKQYVSLILISAMLIVTTLSMYANGLINIAFSIGLFIPAATAFIAALCYGIKCEYDKTQTIIPIYEHKRQQRKNLQRDSVNRSSLYS